MEIEISRQLETFTRRTGEARGYSRRLLDQSQW